MRLEAAHSAIILQSSRELARRRREGLRLYEPLPNALAFHKSTAPERIIIGGNRGGKAQPVNEPVLTPDGWVEIGKLKIGDVIIGGDGNPCIVTGVFPQGVKPVFKVTFGDGSWTRCCEEHLWKVQTRAERFRWEDKKDSWVVLPLKEIREKWGDRPVAIQRATIPECEPWMPRRRTLIDPYLLGIVIGDGCIRDGSAVTAISTSDDEIVAAAEAALSEMGGMRLKRSSSRHAGKAAYDYRIATAEGTNTNHFKDACRALGLLGKRSWEKFVPAEYLFNVREVRLALLQGLMDTDGTVSKPSPTCPNKWATSFCTTSPMLAENVAYLVRSLGGKCSAGKWHRNKYTHKGEKRTGRPRVILQIRMHDECPFRLKRKIERWEKWKEVTERTPNKVLREIDADGEAECVCISVSSPDHTYVTRGMIVTHNSISAALETCYAVLNCHPYLIYPKMGTAVVVAQKETSLGDPIWKILRRPGGAFHVIKDEITKQWRAVRPWQEYDRTHREKWRGNEPLIPQRLIQGRVTYYNKNKGIPEYVKLKTGWEIYFYSDNAAPTKGTVYDLVWFNEEIATWYAEASARLIDRAGKFIWDATPEAGTDELFKLYIRSQKPLEEGATRHVECFELHMLDNPHVAQKDKELFIEKHKDDPIRYQTKVLGKFALQETLVYPTFQPGGIHGVEAFPIPWEWTRYAIIDPGWETTAVLYCAVPPPDESKILHLYDELYLPKCDAERLAKAMALKAPGNWLQAIYLDMRMGKQTQQGGLTVAEQLEDALKRERVDSVLGGFQPAFDDVDAGIERVRFYLGLERGREARCVVHRGKMPWFCWEAEKWRYKRDSTTGVVNVKKFVGDQHLMDCWRYACAANLKWVPAPEASRFNRNGISAKDIRELEQKLWGGGRRRGAAFNLGPISN